MKKLILSSLIATMLFFGGTANAGVAGVTLGVVTGGVASGASFLLIGGVTSFLVAKFVKERTDDNFVLFLATLGWILLDEDRQVMVFKSIDPSNAGNHG